MRPARRALLLGLAAVIPAGITACEPRERAIADGPDPLRALAAGAVSGRYDDAFWSRQRHDRPDLWSRARAYCDGQDVGRHPNCRPVLGLMALERTLERPRTPSPGFEGSLDLEERRGAAERRLETLEPRE